MSWRGPETPGEFPTLGYLVADLIEAKCAIPDGDHVGEPYLLTDEMLRFLLHFYRVNPDAKRDSRGRWRLPFVHARGGQLVRPQKWGKGPFLAAIICAEADPESPVLFDGWDAAGEPVGRPWSTPWIQVTASSEDQSDNVWTALQPMIELGAIHADIPDTGLTRINLPHGGKIEPVTSSAQSRLGQRLTFAGQDQTESWTKGNGLRKVADTQRRNTAGMGGRFLETPNAWDPAEGSVAQETSEGRELGVFFDDVEPGSGSIRNKAERRRMLRKVYGDSWWVDRERIELDIEALLPRDPAQAERWYLNRKRASEDSVFVEGKWDARADLEHVVPPEALIVIGVDGARFVDALVIVATEVATGFQWVIGIWERPESAPDDYEHPMDKVDGAMIDAFQRFSVWRAYIDPQYIDYLVEKWQGRWGDGRVREWLTSRPFPTAWAVRHFVEAVGAGDVSHNGDPDLARHVGNAKRQKVNVYDDQHRQMFRMAKDTPDSPRKMDGAMAAMLSWEARGDAIANDATGGPSNELEETEMREQPGREPVTHRGDMVLVGERYVDRDGPDLGPQRGR